MWLRERNTKQSLLWVTSVYLSNRTNVNAHASREPTNLFLLEMELYYICAYQWYITMENLKKTLKSLNLGFIGCDLDSRSY